MNRKINKVLLAGTAISTQIISLQAEEKKDNKPMNIIFIMSDDHTSQGIGVYNSHLSPLNPTPNIDKLAAEGVVFENCFCNNSISTPSRATTMTGQYSHNNGVLTLDEKLRNDQQYLVKELKQVGYQSAIIGKWHLGTEPSEFDYYKVFTQHGEQGSYFDPLLASSENKNKNFPENTDRYLGHSSDIVTDLSLDWLKNKRDKNRPFFLMHHYKAPHDNFEFAPRYKDYLADTNIPIPSTLLEGENFGSEAIRGKNDSLINDIGTSISARNKWRNYVEMYKITEGDEEERTKAAYNEYVKNYLRCVKGVDDNLARLFTYLKENDLWDNTIIIYSGDQGMMLGEHDLQDKRWMYEECLRMPLIVRVPQSEINGTRNSDLISNIDFAPTVLGWAGVKETPSYMDGKDFGGVFEGKKLKNWRDAIYYRYWMHLTHHNVPAHFGIRTKDYKLIFYYGKHYRSDKQGKKSMVWLKESYLIHDTPAAFELYDLKNDPLETTNVANDPKYSKVLSKLKKKLLKLKEESGNSDEMYPEIEEIIKANF